jgi:hypothetical protein
MAYSLKLSIYYDAFYETILHENKLEIAGEEYLELQDRDYACAKRVPSNEYSTLSA